MNGNAKRSSRNKNGFTLIELLVVISIIGTLSTIAMTSLNGARAKARDARRKSEINALALAAQSYYYDHGSYPTNSCSYGGDWSSTFKSQMGSYFSSFPVAPGATNDGSNYYCSWRWSWGTSSCLGHYVLYSPLEVCDNGVSPINNCGNSGCLYTKILDEY
ncbi:MAG: type II secretion system protein [Candidatus Paceibacterota bacterium]